MARFPLLLALAGVLLAPAATAQPMPPPPSMSDPAPDAKPARKPASKPRAAKPAEAAAGAANPAAKPASQSTAGSQPKPAQARGYTESPSAPRKIDPRDIADPYGGVGPSERTAPTFTPSGRVGVGGKF